MEKEVKSITLICSNYAWTIVNFRLPLIKELKKNGHKVIVVTQYDGYEKEIIEHVDQVQPLFISRKGINPFVDIITIFNLAKIFIKFKPDQLLLFTIKPVIYGAIVAKFFKIKTIVSITGLGTSFISKNWLTGFVKFLYRFSLSSVKTVFFQNNDDKDLFLQQKLVESKVCKLIPGSGIDTNQFSYSPMPANKEITFILIARMLWDKGIGEYVEAAKLIKIHYPDTKFQLLGPLGVENRTAISKEQMAIWVEEGFIEYMGETRDVTKFIKTASCVVLPSYREGTSRVLLEAASIGRPIIASDAPGCREVVEDKITGLLCNPKDCYDLSEKLKTIINKTPEDLEIMGIKGRHKIERQFNHKIVNNIYLDEIN